MLTVYPQAPELTASRKSTLTFCNPCGSLRLKEVKGQLENLLLLFQQELLLPNVCAICNCCLNQDGNPVSKQIGRPSTSQTRDESKQDSSFGKSRKHEELNEEFHDVSVSLEMECKDESENHQEQNKVETTLDCGQTGIQQRREVEKVFEVGMSSISYQCKLCMQGFQTNKDCKIHAIYHIETFMQENEQNKDEYHNKYLQEIEERKHRKWPSKKQVQVNFPSTPSQIAEWAEIKLDLVNDIAKMLSQPKTVRFLYRCNVCTNSEFRYVAPFMQHLKAYHGIEPVSHPWECKLCWKRFGRQVELIKHACIQDSRERSFICDQDGCQEAFTTSRQLKEHCKQHSTHYYNCPKCKSKFQDEDRLKKHMNRIHTLVFKCSECPQTFNKIMARSVHERNVHRKGSNQFMCELCGKVFFQQVRFQDA